MGKVGQFQDCTAEIPTIDKIHYIFIIFYYFFIEITAICVFLELS